MMVKDDFKGKIANTIFGDFILSSAIESKRSDFLLCKVKNWKNKEIKAKKIVDFNDLNT